MFLFRTRFVIENTCFHVRCCIFIGIVISVPCEYTVFRFIMIHVYVKLHTRDLKFVSDIAYATSLSSGDSTDKKSLACPTFLPKSVLSGLHSPAVETGGKC